MKLADLEWKMAVGGAGAVGKTTIIHRYVTNEFIPDMKMTIGVQMHRVEITMRGKRIGMMFWDLGGQERFWFVIPSYMNGAKGVFLLFDMSRYKTLLELGKWIELARERAPDAPVMVIGTKYDSVDAETAAKMEAEGRRFAAENGCAGYASTSSKWGVNIAESMEYMVNHLLDGDGIPRDG